MTPPLTISEQERLLDSVKLFMAAADRVVKAQRDLDMINSTSHRQNLRRAIMSLKAVAEHEMKFINEQQKQLF